MELKVKFFDELTTRELYEMLKARAEIFVVEQNCVYQDLDDRDYTIGVCQNVESFDVWKCSSLVSLLTFAGIGKIVSI